MGWFSNLFRPSAAPKLPAKAGRYVFVAEAKCAGTSMLPTFGLQEQIALELCAFSDLRSRDTVIYWHETGQYVHHRLSHRDDRTMKWITQGDNNATRDTGHMTADEFVGRTHKLLA